MGKSNDKDSYTFDFEPLRLKDHLNASFEKDNITVTEDLIQKTLQAIKEDKSPEMDYQTVNKEIKIPVRRLVQAAAVFLIAFIGFQAFNNNLRFSDLSIGSKKSAESSGADLSATTYDATAKSDSLPEERMESSATEDTPALFSKTAADENTSSKISAKEAEDSGTLNENAAAEGAASYATGAGLFTDIYPIVSDQVVSFTITKAEQETLSQDSKEVSELFSILNAYSITTGDKNITDTWNYKITLETDNEQSYVILIGDGIQVKQVNGTSEAEVYYFLDNKDALLQSVEEFYTNLR